MIRYGACRCRRLSAPCLLVPRGILLTRRASTAFANHHDPSSSENAVCSVVCARADRQGMLYRKSKF